MKTIKAFAPATIANFNVGHDLLGLSFDTLGDEVILRTNGLQENRIRGIKNGAGLPWAAEKNCCTVVVRKMQQRLGPQAPFVDIHIEKGFASGSGMGSSSASSAAAAFAYNELLGRPLSPTELVAFAAEGERAACGAKHLDNVAPAILGGLVLAYGNDTDSIIQLPVPPGLQAVTLFPKITINTADARRLLPEAIPRPTALRQVGLMGAFVSSLYEKNLRRFAQSMQDLIAEPSRKPLIPHFDEMRAAALQKGALAFGISGSGPTVFAIAKSEADALSIRQTLEGFYALTDIEAQSFQAPIASANGARICS